MLLVFSLRYITPRFKFTKRETPLHENKIILIKLVNVNYTNQLENNNVQIY